MQTTANKSHWAELERFGRLTSRVKAEYRRTLRSSVGLLVVALLAACAHTPPPGMSPSRLVSEPVYIEGFGDLYIRKSGTGRLEVSVPAQGVSLSLDPEVHTAELARPIIEDDYTLLPIRVSTANCGNRIAAYVLRGNRVESFDYLGADCSQPILDRSSDTSWKMTQRVGTHAVRSWSFDGRTFTSTVRDTRPASQSRTTRQAGVPAAATAAGPAMAPSTTNTSPSGKIVVDLM